MDKTVIWLIGEYIHACDDRSLFEVIGLASTEQEAIAACQERHHFIGPLTVGEFVYKPRAEWPGLRYPLAETEGEVI